MTESILDRTKVVIFDVDGTIADCEHRRKYVDGTLGHTDWKKFRAETEFDTFIVHVCDIAKRFIKSGDHVAFFSARNESERDYRTTNFKMDW